VPEVIALAIVDGLEEYLGWIDREVAQESEVRTQD
jgi:uncharacterized protein involved in tolerance to divalent cations